MRTTLIANRVIDLRKQQIKIMLVLICGAMVMGCQTQEKNACLPTTLSMPVCVYDDNLESGMPCEPPCWQNIVPGKSNDSEAIDKLRDLSFVDKESIQTITDKFLVKEKARIVWNSIHEPSIGGWNLHRSNWQSPLYIECRSVSATAQYYR